jgi:hypothetical protein
MPLIVKSEIYKRGCSSSGQVVNQVVIVPIGESSKRGAPFGTQVTSGTGLSVVGVVVSSNTLLQYKTTR